MCGGRWVIGTQKGRGELRAWPRARTDSVIRMPYARLIHGTLRRQSARSESTRGRVSESELLKATLFCVALRNARSPLDAPAADMIHGGLERSTGADRAAVEQRWWPSLKVTPLGS